MKEEGVSYHTAISVRESNVEFHRSQHSVWCFLLFVAMLLKVPQDCFLCWAVRSSDNSASFHLEGFICSEKFVVLMEFCSFKVILVSGYVQEPSYRRQRTKNIQEADRRGESGNIQLCRLVRTRILFQFVSGRNGCRLISNPLKKR